MHHDLMIKLCISHAASVSTLPCHKKSAKNERNSAPCPGKTPTFVPRLRFPVLLFLLSPPIFLSTQLQKTSLARLINFWKVVIYINIYMYGRDSSIFHNNIKLVLHNFHSSIMCFTLTEATLMGTLMSKKHGKREGLSLHHVAINVERFLTLNKKHL